MLSVDRFCFLFDQNVENKNTKMYPARFASKWLFICEISEKLPLRTHLRQTSIFTRRAVRAKGWKRVLRTMIAIHLEIIVFVLMCLNFLINFA